MSMEKNPLGAAMFVRPRFLCYAIVKVLEKRFSGIRQPLRQKDFLDLQKDK